MTESKIVIEKFDSKTLKNNPLGDPSTRPLPIYLPPGYTEGEKRFPVAYLLAGYAGSGLHFFNRVAWDENIQERLDRLIQSKKCKPML